MEQEIIKTLAYWQAFADIPLTLTEVQKYFINNEGHKRIPLFDIQKILNDLIKKQVVAEKNGFYSLRKHAYILNTRDLKSKYALMKWKKFLKRGRFLAYVPYISSVSVTGSVALGAAEDESDIDILTTAKAGKIWTVRFFNTIISWVLGVRGYKNKFKNRLCFNHYASTDAVSFGPEPIDNIIKKIRVMVWDEENKYQHETIFYLRAKYPFLFFKKSTEWFLDKSHLGILLERFFAFIQLKDNRKSSVVYPKNLEPLHNNSSNLIFFYSDFVETENKYREILSAFGRNND